MVREALKKEEKDPTNIRNLALYRDEHMIFDPDKHRLSLNAVNNNTDVVNHMVVMRRDLRHRDVEEANSAHPAVYSKSTAIGIPKSAILSVFQVFWMV